MGSCHVNSGGTIAVATGDEHRGGESPRSRCKVLKGPDRQTELLKPFDETDRVSFLASWMCTDNVGTEVLLLADFAA